MSYKYSIVIPTSGNWQQLSNCLETVVRSSDMKTTEIIVVDNASTDRTEEVCKAYQQMCGESLVYLKQTENLGFCKATNIGMRAAKGEYIVWLNDDTLVLPRWLDELANSIETPHTYHPNIGLAGPMSNNCGGRQKKKDYINIKPEDLPEVHKSIEQNKDLYRVSVGQGRFAGFEPLAAFLSGFCLMLKREVMDKIGLIDEQYSPGGYCDNDYIVRAINAGYGCVLNQRTLVYHYGSQTLDKLYPEEGRGTRNWAKYIKKHLTVKDNKLLMIQRVKLDNDLQFNTFEKCAKVNKELIDGVVILSDKSQHPKFTEAYCKELFGDKLRGFYTNSKDVKLDEIRDRLFLMKEAEKLKFDWIINLDHDEAFPKHTTRKRLNQLMNPLNPALFGYTFLYNNYWRGETMARIDGPWGSGFFSRMWKSGVFTPTLRPRNSVDDVGLHCGNRPMSIPEDAFKLCDLVIDHLGYIDSEEVERKHANYNKIDVNSGDVQKFQTGTQNYEHLMNEVGIQVVVPRPFTVSVNLMVKDEELALGQQLMNYESIASEFIICDTGSTDNTMKYLDDIGVPYYQMVLDDDFSKIRNDMIKRSTRTHIIHVDADEHPEEFYLHKTVAMLNLAPDVALAHMKTQHRDGRYQVIKQPRIFKNDGRFYYYGRIHETLDKSLEENRGFTHQDLKLSIFNPGFLCSPEKIKSKLEFYGRLLEKEVVEHPTNSKALFELALHYRNWGRKEDSVDALNKALASRPDLVRARLELVLIRVNEALEELNKCTGMQTDEEVLGVLRQLHTALSPYEFKPVMV